MPKRKRPLCSDPPSILKQNAPVIVGRASRTGRCKLTENKEHVAHQGWDHFGDAFKQNPHSDSETEWIGQTSISSTWSQSDNMPPLIKSLDNKDDNIEISSQSSIHHSEEEYAYKKNDSDSYINSIYSPSLPSEHPNGSQSSPWNVECSSDNESLIIIHAGKNFDEPFFAKDPCDSISDQSILMTPSPNLVNEAIHFGSQTSESDHRLGMDQQESDQENEAVSISTGSASPERQNMLRGSEWLQSVFSKMPVENGAVGTPPKETFKKISVVKGGLAEKLENILLDFKADVALRRKSNPSENPNKLQIKIRNMAALSVCHAVADCDKVTSSTASSSKAELNIPLGHTLAVVLNNSLVQRWTICNNCVLSIVPTWQILHVPALQKSFILCPSVIDVHLSLDSEQLAKNSEDLSIVMCPHPSFFAQRAHAKL